jgi:uncharacterized protein (TIGR03085 family)
VTWVEVERQSLADDFRAADPDGRTLCHGWTARHLCAHLVQRQRATLRNVWDQLSPRAPGNERFMRRLVENAASPDGYAALVDTFAEGPRHRSLLTRFDEPLNLLEYVVHHEDLRRGSGPVPPRDLPTAEVAEIWRRATPILRRAYRKAPVGVELVPDGEAVVLARSAPSTVTVSGSPIDLVLHAFGRRGAADVRVDGQPDDIASFTRWASRG